METDRQGRTITTASELDQMTPMERHEHFLASLVRDLSELPPVYVERLQRRGRELIARRDAEQARQDIPHAS